MLHNSIKKRFNIFKSYLYIKHFLQQRLFFDLPKIVKNEKASFENGELI